MSSFELLSLTDVREYTETDLFAMGGHVVTRILKSAIQANDLPRLRELLSERIVADLRRCDVYDLFAEVVSLEKFEVLKFLLEIFSRYDSFKICEPILMLGLILAQGDEFLMKLIELNGDVNQRDAQLRTPLHLAVQRESMRTALTFIRNGADVDAKDCEGYTPMHFAVQAANKEAVCMLLYYGANANEVSYSTKATPFMAALCTTNYEIQEVLIDFVTDFNLENVYGFNTLYLALKHRSLFSQEIVARGGKMADNIDLLFTDVQVFNIMWPMITRDVLMKQRFPLLKKLFCCYNVVPDEFLHYLYTLITWEYVDFLLDQYVNKPDNYHCTLFADIAECFSEFDISLCHRLSVFYILLSIGAPVCMNDVYHVYRCFGYNEEFEALMIANPEIIEDHLYRNVPFFLDWVCTNNTDTLDDFHCREEKLVPIYQLVKFYTPSHMFRKSFFSCFPFYTEIHDEGPFKHYQLIAQVFRRRSVPSLLEVSRNAIRKIIYANCYRHSKGVNLKFYTAISFLPLPKVVKDILVLKRPLYFLEP